ncbi:MAG: hypothetical protein EZS28_030141, partial [Streblomastix strix]
MRRFRLTQDILYQQPDISCWNVEFDNDDDEVTVAWLEQDLKLILIWQSLMNYNITTSKQEISGCQYKISLEIITKGSPELIRKLCMKETLPDDFDQQLQTFTQQGLRIIALANKEI